MYLLGAATSYIILPLPKISAGCGPALQFKWKNDQSRAIPLAAKYKVCFFSIESARHVMLLFLWIASQNGMVVLFGSGYRSAASDTARKKR